jgi:Flp pilus assembly pilin Flp
MKAIKRMLRDESGQGTMEYILIVGLIVIFLVTALYIFRDELKAFIEKVQVWLGQQSVQEGS